ncbi:MAG: NACHT domain-containing protein, partial [bacterium]|nr:NACHT domain-containing protein [bacterium]
LNSFYYPTKIIAEGKKITVIDLGTFPRNCKLVVQGTAGQGKSILLRYLASQELKKGCVLPIFVELRKVSESNSLERLILDGLKQLGIEVSMDDLDPILSTGKCALLLDAFDELGSAYIRDTITSIESWCCKFHNLPIIVSSRPDSSIQNSAHFNVYKIEKLRRSDFEPLLTKLFIDTEQVKDIIHNIDGKKITSLVSTPLLLTLLAIHYVEEGDVPQSLEGFYENLFHVMCSRHDATKPGYVREFSSGLNKDELNHVFNIFCLECNRSNYTSISFQTAKDIAKKSLNYTDHNSKSESLFLDDIVKVTCLLLKEGHQYHFIHKSIMEYHAAKCISKMPESTKINFYKHAIELFSKYKQVLDFLFSLDKLLYIEYFKIPLLDKLIEELDLEYLLSEISVKYNHEVKGLVSSINHEGFILKALDIYQKTAFEDFYYKVFMQLKPSKTVKRQSAYMYIKESEPDALNTCYQEFFKALISKISYDRWKLEDFVKTEREKYKNFNFFE